MVCVFAERGLPLDCQTCFLNIFTPPLPPSPFPHPSSLLQTLPKPIQTPSQSLSEKVGSIQPIEEIAAALDTLDYPPGSRPLLHSDAAQSLGKVLVDVQALGVDMLTIVGHKVRSFYLN